MRLSNKLKLKKNTKTSINPTQNKLNRIKTPQKRNKQTKKLKKKRNHTQIDRYQFSGITVVE